MSKSEGVRCEKCRKTFPTLRQAIQHAQTEHGMTNKQREKELKLHQPKR